MRVHQVSSKRIVESTSTSTLLCSKLFVYLFLFSLYARTCHTTRDTRHVEQSVREEGTEVTSREDKIQKSAHFNFSYAADASLSLVALRSTLKMHYWLRCCRVCVRVPPCCVRSCDFCLHICKLVANYE